MGKTVGVKKEKITEAWLNSGRELSFGQQIQLVIKLSIPAILAELTSIIMQYIDAAMVGSMGAEASAAIGLVSSSSWLLGGLCISAATGFSVQVAHLAGAGRREEARDVFRNSLVLGLVFGVLLSLFGSLISPVLPIWLGGKGEITSAASRYFLIFSCALPATQFRQLAGSMLQCSGDMKTPSILNIMMCMLDVFFNFLLIFPTRQIVLGNARITIVGAGLGVAGAALGTALSEVVTAGLMLWAACIKSDYLRLTRGFRKGLNADYYKRAARISLPLALEHIILCGAQVALTHITAPLGTVAIAANTLAVTAESLCYMPGYGVGTAATTLVGQSLGAGKRELAKRYAWLSVSLGIGIMSVMGVLMFIFSPYMFAMLTPDPEVRLLGVQILRIEAFAEPLYAASIVASGALRGAGDTRIPSILNLVSMWGVRITAAALLAPRIGLYGVWLAMCGELCVRGVLFLIRLKHGKWLSQSLITTENKENE
ncbi:MAG: MATE family efflux transporter [Bacteroides sp.]|nr:MATE family efflux transporter [Bacteroides sp.]MCM1550759.1 MATE family efflux transporter [Clostridium sp.]